MKIICPYCNYLIAYFYIDFLGQKLIFQGSCRCPKCKDSFGFSNTRNKEKVDYIYG